MKDAVELVVGLRGLGFDRLVATPHVRPPRWDQERSSLLGLRDELVAAVGAGGPAIDVAAENYFDDSFWHRFQSGSLLRYPGDRAVLVELPAEPEDFPLGFDQRLFEMNVKGLRPVLAHPERLETGGLGPELIERLALGGTTLLISLSSLAGGFLDSLRRRAQAIISRAQNLAAASDAHSAAEIPTIGRGLKRLRKLVGEAGVERMLSTTPQALMARVG